MRIARDHALGLGQQHLADDRRAPSRGARRPRASCARAAPRRSGRRSVITGLSAVIGSWKIIDMRVARSSRSRAARGARDVLALQPDAAADRPASVCGSRPITACAITDLPEPDSPTRQSDLAARRPSNETSRTAVRPVAAGAAAPIVRPRTSRIGRSAVSRVIVAPAPSSGRACRAGRRRGC